MPFKSYLPQNFDTTNENLFFREVSEMLNQKYNLIDSLCVLIGNLSCNGHQIDAVFIKSGQISIIDFKNYGGRLTFSENNPWTIESNNNRIFVSGGSVRRNPYQQINAYRHSMIDFLNHKQEMIFATNHDNLNLGHISGIVLFHQNIEFDHNTIPQRIPFMHVTDKRNFLSRIDAIYSNSLLLNDNEISRVLEALNITENNLLNLNIDFNVQVPQNVVPNYKLNIVRQLTRNLAITSHNTTNILSFYQVLLNLESYKESQVEGIGLINYNDIDILNDAMEIDYNQFPGFRERLDRNAKEAFPKDIFLGLTLMDGEQPRIFFSQLILASEINLNDNKNRIYTADFKLYSKTLIDLNLSEELIDELSEKIDELETLNEKVDFLIKNLDALNLTATIGIKIGFSEKNLTNSQCVTEFKKIKEVPGIIDNSDVINNFISNIPLDNKKIVSGMKLLQISDLNESQLESVRAALTNKFTVITGPPGTGKTQVVINIIANAIINKKKILFASKNNKAVDNVLERLRLILKNEYLIRIGRKDIIKEQLLPMFDRIMTGINDNRFHNREKDLDILGKELNNIKTEIKNVEFNIEECLNIINDIPYEIRKIELNIQKLTQELEQFVVNLNFEEKELLYQNICPFEIDYHQINTLRYQLDNFRANFFSRLKFRVFYKNKILESINLLYSMTDTKIKNYLFISFPIFDKQNNINLDNLIAHVDEAISLNKKMKIIMRLKTLISSEIELNKQKEGKLKKAIEQKPELIRKQNELNSRFVEKSRDYLNLEIENILSSASNTVISEFKNYLPDNIPYKSSELDLFEKRVKNLLNIFFVASTANLSIKNGISLTNEIFDILVIDEASQCDIASAIPLIYRAKQVVIIGDPLQLKHITKVQKYEQEFILDKINIPREKFDYVNKSLYDYSYELANLSNIKTYFLNEHYRCHPKIINYSNEYFYQRKLGQELKIKTNEKNFYFGERGVVWYNVQGNVHKRRNTNDFEITTIHNLIENIFKNYPTCDLGVTTPFRHQEEDLKNKLRHFLDNHQTMMVESIHKFQGDEKDIIILSLVVVPSAKQSLTNFINIRAPYLLNVAVTRAKSTLYIVGDHNFCRSLNFNTPLYQLATYTERNGKIITEIN